MNRCRISEMMEPTMRTHIPSQARIMPHGITCPLAVMFAITPLLFACQTQPNTAKTDQNAYEQYTAHDSALEANRIHRETQEAWTRYQSRIRTAKTRYANDEIARDSYHRAALIAYKAELKKLGQ